MTTIQSNPIFKSNLDFSCHISYTVVNLSKFVSKFPHRSVPNPKLKSNFHMKPIIHHQILSISSCKVLELGLDGDWRVQLNPQKHLSILKDHSTTFHNFHRKFLKNRPCLWLFLKKTEHRFRGLLRKSEPLQLSARYVVIYVITPSPVLFQF